MNGICSTKHLAEHWLIIVISDIENAEGHGGDGSSRRVLARYLPAAGSMGVTFIFPPLSHPGRLHCRPL